jgi:hypothetical protein
MVCGVMSTIASAYTPRHKGKYLQNRQHRIFPIKNGSIKLDHLRISPTRIYPSYLKRYSPTLIDSSYLEKILSYPNRSNWP